MACASASYAQSVEEFPDEGSALLFKQFPYSAVNRSTCRGHVIDLCRARTAAQRKVFAKRWARRMHSAFLPVYQEVCAAVRYCGCALLVIWGTSDTRYGEYSVLPSTAAVFIPEAVRISGACCDGTGGSEIRYTASSTEAWDVWYQLDRSGSGDMAVHQMGLPAGQAGRKAARAILKRCVDGAEVAL